MVWISGDLQQKGGGIAQQLTWTTELRSPAMMGLHQGNILIPDTFIFV